MEEQKEAVIILAKCAETHKTYGMRVEKLSPDNWLITWSFLIKGKNAKHEGYDKAFITGNIQYATDYPGCPYCGKTGFTLCGTCGRLGCTITKNRIYTCEWCKTQGTLGNYSGDAISSRTDL